MPRKPMTILYYTGKKACREDCDTLGIDRRRVRTIRDGYGIFVPVWCEDRIELERVVAYLKVSAALVHEVGVDALQNDDSGVYGF